MRQKRPKDGASLDILWFPHYFINATFNNINTYPIKDIESGNDPNVLFASERILMQTTTLQLLGAAFRDAWLQLQNKPPLILSLLENYLDDPSFVTYLHRSCGFYNFHASQISETKSQTICSLALSPSRMSRMIGDYHVRFCDSLGVKLPRFTRRRNGRLIGFEGDATSGIIG